MTREPVTSSRARTAAFVLAASVAGAIALPSAAVAAASPVVEVRASELQSPRPADGGWFVDWAGDAEYEVTKDGPDNDPAMRMTLTSTSDKVYVYNTFGPGSRPTDIPGLLNGASYDYAGINVNFQIEVIFEPADVDRYGPAGTATACTPASTWYGWGLTAEADWCYTVLKWEPYVSPGTDDWTHVDLSVDTAAQSSSKRGGWVSSKQLGQYPGNVSNGQLMATYLGEMADYEVTSFAFGVGSGTAGPVAGYLREYTIGDTIYRFLPEAATPEPAPAADSDELEDLIESENIDVDADTDRFVTTGATNTDLSRVDAQLPVNGAYENWTDPTDAFVDVYTYSTAVFIGTFPVVNGDVVLTNANLRHLQPGIHHFLFRGQSSGTVAVVRFVVFGLAATGADGEEDAAAALVGAGLLGAGVTALLLARGRPWRRRAHRRLS